MPLQEDPITGQWSSAPAVRQQPPTTSSEVVPAPQCGSSKPPVDALTACFQSCNDQAKAQEDKCKQLICQFKEVMKQQGCPGVSCNSKPLRRVVRKQRVVKRKCSRKKSRRRCK